MTETPKVHPAFITEEGKFKCLVFLKVIEKGKVGHDSDSIWAFKSILDIETEKIDGIPQFLLNQYGSGNYLVMPHVFSNLDVGVKQEIIVKNVDFKMEVVPPEDKSFPDDSEK